MPGTKSGTSRSTADQCDELRRKMQLLGMKQMFVDFKGNLKMTVNTSTVY